MGERGCVLVVVGSRDLAGNDDAYRAIQTVIEEHGPRQIVSGGAAGVDSMTEEVAYGLGYDGDQVHVELPTVKQWGGEGGYRWRDERMAKLAECAVRIFSDTTRTYGSGWTVDTAERRGAKVTRIRIATLPYSDTLIS